MLKLTIKIAFPCVHGLMLLNNNIGIDTDSANAEFLRI